MKALLIAYLARGIFVLHTRYKLHVVRTYTVGRVGVESFLQVDENKKHTRPALLQRRFVPSPITVFELAPPASALDERRLLSLLELPRRLCVLMRVRVWFVVCVLISFSPVYTFFVATAVNTMVPGVSIVCASFFWCVQVIVRALNSISLNPFWPVYPVCSYLGNSVIHAVSKYLDPHVLASLGSRAEYLALRDVVQVMTRNEKIRTTTKKKTKHTIHRRKDKPAQNKIR